MGGGIVFYFPIMGGLCEVLGEASRVLSDPRDPYIQNWEPHR